jgi:hypothetical protein
MAVLEVVLRGAKSDWDCGSGVVVSYLGSGTVDRRYVLRKMLVG